MIEIGSEIPVSGQSRGLKACFPNVSRAAPGLLNLAARLLMDIRYALRMLAKAPGFTLMAVLTLGLCIGLNTVVFTLYESVAWKPLPVRSPGEMIRVTGRYDGPSVDTFNYANYEDLRDHSRSLASVIATSTPQNVLCVLPGAKPAEAQVFNIRLVSTNYFDALGVSPAIGRAFAPGERAVAVVSNAFWKNRLNSDPAVLGKTLTINGTAFSILGVTPARFAGTGVPAQCPDLWIPISTQSAVLPGVDWLHDASARELQILARRKADLSIEQTAAELRVLGRAWPLVETKPIQLDARHATFFQTDAGEFDTFGQVAGILSVAVALILLIGCVNLINLLLARGAARRREIAVRLALGARRSRIVRQLCTESALIGVLGGMLGFLISLWACEWIRVWISGALQSVSNNALSISLDLTPDWRVFAYTSVLSVITGVMVGVWPAVKSARADLISAMKHEAAGSSALTGWTGRNVLLGGQVTASLMLLAGAGILFRGARYSSAADAGFETRHLMLINVNPKSIAAMPSARSALMRQVVGRMQALPEVTSAAWVDRPPFLGHGSGPLMSDADIGVQCLFNPVSDRYFETLGIPFLAGRDFTRQEIERGEAVAIVSESAAQRFWPGREAIGRRISGQGWLKPALKHESFTVIGVVKSVRSTYLSKIDGPFVYLPKAPPSSQTLMLVRTRIAPEGVFRSAFAALSALHSNLPSQSFMIGLEKGPMELQKLMAEAPALVSSVLGLLALILASVGVYGVVAYLVTQRTRDIAVHIALGARNRDVIAMALKNSLMPVGAGSVLGFIGSLGLSGFLAAIVALPDVPDLTYGAGTVDPATFLGALGTLSLAVLVAALVPVRRAIRVEPTVALRAE